MYILFSVLLFFMMLCAIIFHFRKKRIICRIQQMSVCEKLCRLDQLTLPFGFQYDLCQDMFTSAFAAWQRDYGYCQLYDDSMVHFNMVVDCEPIYFDYHGYTWLIEFWKGQYGINIGGEIGIYRANSIVPKHLRAQTLFHTVPDDELPKFSIRLLQGTLLLFKILPKMHWWLAAFRMGRYARPELLRMDCSITFLDCKMAQAFLDGMLDAGYCADDLCLLGTVVCFSFDVPKSVQPAKTAPAATAFSMWKDRLFLRWYCRITRPFCHTLEQLLYLYEYLPFAFKHMMRIHCFKSKHETKQKRGKSI